ncbi:unnamed protein product [Paramecium pentaurelia]|uniref:Uncharacterized protein n=1 Tax=Paramecium pentaurelia TaxID=43138 RepID=A0A8S1VW29_9CILI|nr:unnamed protein product [Paramecium pentaurelia]
MNQKYLKTKQINNHKCRKVQNKNDTPSSINKDLPFFNYHSLLLELSLSQNLMGLQKQNIHHIQFNLKDFQRIQQIEIYVYNRITLYNHKIDIIFQ